MFCAVLHHIVSSPHLSSCLPALAAAALPPLANAARCLSTAAPPPQSSGSGGLAPGTAFTLAKRFSAADVAAFCQLSGDSNPIHTQPQAAAAAGLPGCIVPGLLSASLFPAIIGSTFPGAVYASQTLKFKNFALVGDSLTATLRVERASGSRVSFATQCRSARSGLLVVEGTALAIIPQQAQQAQQQQ